MGIHGDGVKYVRPQFHWHREDANHIGADGHKTGLAQRELTGKPVGHVHGQPDDGVNEAQIDNPPHIGVNFRLNKACHTEKNDEGGNGEHDISFVIHDYTFSVIFSPNNPVGL